MAQIHPSAIVDKNAIIADGVVIGAYCVVGANVNLAKNVVLKSHVVVDGHTKIGEATIIHPFAVIGSSPQDLKFAGEITTLEIGSNNTIREYVTINPGTKGGGGKTIIGNNNLLMIATHIGHDCMVGNHVVLANNATIAGHVTIGDRAVIGGMSAVHQFVRIGKHAMIGGMSGIEGDIIPYGSAMGERASLAGLNLIGLKRSDLPREDVNALRAAYRILFSDQGSQDERTQEVIEQFSDNESVMDIINFIQTDGSRALCKPKARS